MCGGSLKIPKIQRAISDLFPQAEVLSGINPDEVLALGAARQANFLPETWDKDFSDLAISVSAATKGIFVKVRYNSCLQPKQACITSNI
jgi:molecular chaperone DnaK (HSP70)